MKIQLLKTIFATSLCAYLAFSSALGFAQNNNSLRLISTLPPEQINQQIIQPSLNSVDRQVLVSLYAMLWAANDLVTNPPDPNTTRGLSYVQNYYRILLPYKAQIQKTMSAANGTMDYLGAQIGVSGSQFKRALGIQEVTEPKACDRCDPAYTTLKTTGNTETDMVYKGLMDFNSYMNSPGTATTKTTPDQPAFELAPAAFFSFYQGFYPEYYRLRSATLTQRAAKVEVILEQQQKVQLANEEAAETRRKWLATPEGQKYQAEQAAAAKQKADAERLALSKEYPYYALVTCEFNNQNTNITSCFSTNIGTELELRNGNDYNMYKGVQLLMGEVGKVTAEGLVINLRKNFTLKMQNSSDTLLLGVKVFDMLTGNVIYQKKTGFYGVIYVRN